MEQKVNKEDITKYYSLPNTYFNITNISFTNNSEIYLPKVNLTIDNATVDDNTNIDSGTEVIFFVQSGSSSLPTFISPDNRTIYKNIAWPSPGSTTEIVCKWDGFVWKISNKTFNT